MTCFSLAWIENFLIWLVVVCAIIGILKILVPWIVSLMGVAIDARFGRIINIIIIAVVLVYVIIILFDVFSCLFSGHIGGGYLGTNRPPLR
jgi:hypothetical protein